MASLLKNMIAASGLPPRYEPRISDIGFVPNTKAGVSVTKSSAMSISAVHRAVQVISNSIRVIPCKVYQRTGPKTKEPAPTHPIYRLLHDAPNHRITPSRFWKLMARWVLLWGNGYAEIQRDSKNVIIGLWPIHPSRVSGEIGEDGEILYSVYGDRNGVTKIEQGRMLHFRDGNDDEVMGISKVGQGRQAMGLAVRAEEYGAKFFANNAQPGVVLEHPGRLRGDENKVREQWQKAYNPDSGIFSVAVLQGGLKANNFAMPNTDAQFLETRKLQVVEIARFFDVTPHKLYEMGRATWGNIESENISFAQDAVLPLAVEMEDECTAKLLRPEERDGFFVAFVMDGLLRADVVTRNQAYQLQRNNGALSSNEWRAREDMNPIGPEGDIYTVAAGIQNLKTLLNPVTPDAANPPQPDPTPDEPPTDEQPQEDGAAAVVTPSAETGNVPPPESPMAWVGPVLRDVYVRMYGVAEHAEMTAKKSGKWDTGWRGRFERRHGDKVREALEPLAQAMALAEGGDVTAAGGYLARLVAAYMDGYEGDRDGVKAAAAFMEAIDTGDVEGHSPPGR